MRAVVLKGGNYMGDTVLTRVELVELLEYSCTVPTGTTIGKRWRCATKYRDRENTEWMIGEYVEHPDVDLVGIDWTWACSAPGEPHRGPLR